jgi:hypothetical protein
MAMKKSALLLSLGVLLAAAGCAQNGTGDSQLSARIQTLENSVAALRKENDDLALKGRITSSLLFRSPLEDFFASPEFWERVYDSGMADCASRCIRQIQQHRAQCAQIQNANQRLQCYQEAANRGAQCQRQCAGL